jgi:AMP-polyphosphate phosphotransferase
VVNDSMSINLSDFELGEIYTGNFVQDLAGLQEQLALQQQLHIAHKRRTLIVFEGWDHNGQGAAIQRITAALDPRHFKVFPIFAPTAEENDQHFLARFWGKLPSSGNLHIWDHSHYSRVLSDRVNGAVHAADWNRGYDEINEFESQQIDIGTNLIKIFVHVTAEIQNQIVRARLSNPAKHWKVSAESFRQLEMRNDYEAAAEAMFKQTDTRWAPWTIVDGNNKEAAQIEILRTVLDKMKSHVPQDFPELAPEIMAFRDKYFG